MLIIRNDIRGHIRLRLPLAIDKATRRNWKLLLRLTRDLPS